MEHEQYRLTLRGPSGEILESMVTIVEEPESFQLEVHLRDEIFSGEAGDVFEAFAQARGSLWRRGILALCYGASRNVFPSPMARDMGGGMKAYRLAIGHQALSKDLVFIFDTGPDVDPVPPEEQAAFYNQWLVSLR